MTAKNIGINCGKGGVAKTTTAVNLACYLAKSGLRTLLVDGDPQGDSADCLGLTPEPGLSGWVGSAILASTASAKAHIQSASESLPLWILPGDAHTVRLENALSSNNVPVDFLGRLVANDPYIQQNFDVIVWDTPASGRLMEMIVHLSDLLIAPVRPGQLDVRGLARFMRMAGNTNAHTLILPTMFRWTDNICSSNVDNIIEAWPENLIHINCGHRTYCYNGVLVVPERVAIRRSQDYGISVFDHAPADDSALAYTALGDAVLRFLAQPYPLLNAEGA